MKISLLAATATALTFVPNLLHEADQPHEEQQWETCWEREERLREAWRRYNRPQQAPRWEREKQLRAAHRNQG